MPFVEEDGPSGPSARRPGKAVLRGARSRGPLDTLVARTLTSQLADDLGWLEQHCRQQPDQAQAASQLRLATALVRNCIGPLLDDQPVVPLHIVVVGGAGAGKSTVANLLSGVPAAE